MQAYSSPILLIPVNALLSTSTKIFLRFAGSEKEIEPQYEFSHSLQRRDDVKNTRRLIVWNGFLESSISDLSKTSRKAGKNMLSRVHCCTLLGIK
jgi:hypothetical protein